MINFSLQKGRRIQNTEQTKNKENLQWQITYEEYLTSNNLKSISEIFQNIFQFWFYLVQDLLSFLKYINQSQ